MQQDIDGVFPKMYEDMSNFDQNKDFFVFVEKKDHEFSSPFYITGCELIYGYTFS